MGASSKARLTMAIWARMSSGRRRCRSTWIACLSGGACLLFLLALAFAPRASAGTFTVYNCHDPAGAVAGTGEWSVAEAHGGYITYRSSCAAGGEGSFGLTMGPNPVSEYFNGDGDTMTYTAPAPLSILAYSLRLYSFGGPCSIQDGQCANGFGEVFVNHTGQSDPNYDYRNLGYGAATATVGAGRLSKVSTVTVGVGCDPGQDLGYPCPGFADPEAQALVSEGTFTLLDPSVPSVSDLTGSLVAGGTLSGTDTIDFTASDEGGGVYSASVLIDGHQIVSEVPNSNDGSCVDLAPPGSATMAFATSRPCRTSENISIPLDTTQLSPGQHHLRVTIEDAAGEEASAYDGTIAVSGPPVTASATGAQTSSSDSPAPRGPANGTGASDEARLTVRWAHSRKATRTSRYGRYARVVGRLTTATGQAISGASIGVEETPTAEGASTAALEGARTDAGGAWSLTLPRDLPSSSLRFTYRSHLGDTAPVATATLTLRVHAGVALGITPHLTSVGHRIFFKGRVHGPIPPGGKQLVLEASSGGGWIQFHDIRTNARGHYHASYRFRFPGPVTYRFRVLSPYEADFPFLGGASNAVTVRER
jgi:hypothetical protein